ncbi:MAG TPA: cytochrome P450 [Pseudonocardiaceae bacterium]|nr:cytochrome P450 [Pseudonocardiaceae bacterium]
MTTAHQAPQTQPDGQQALGRLFDPANRPNPYPVFHRLRESGPFAVLDNALVVIGDHDRCAAILRDPTMSSDRRRSLLPRNLSEEHDESPVSFLSLDPPDHTRLRRLVSKAFTPRVIAALEPEIRRIVDELFAEVADVGSLDVVPQLAYPLPVRIITELLGVPRADHERFEGWGRRLVRGLDPALSFTDQSEIDDIHDAQLEFRAYFRELIAQRRRTPADDLLSKLVRIEESGDVLTEDELVGTCVLLLVAGHETTANLIAGGILALLRNPDQLAALRADPSLVSSTVEESLRYDTPVQLTTRIVREPTTIGDIEIPADAVLLLLLGAANRDPAAFAEPDRFDITRDARQHLSFAAGIHFCLGAGLARLEASIALSAFANRVRSPELDEDSLRYRPHVNLRGPERMIVSFDAISG